MNKILLINRIDTNDNSSTRKRIFFLLGRMNQQSRDNLIIDTINNSGLVNDNNDILYKYDGVELNIPVQSIPRVVNIFAKANISIYSIYEIYNPD